jgi:hypothetical protein
MMTAVLTNKMILYIYLCTFVFTSIKLDDFQLCCVISKSDEKNSGFIAVTLYIYFMRKSKDPQKNNMKTHVAFVT